MPRKPATPTPTPTPPATPSLRILRHLAIGEASYRPGDVIPVASIPAHVLRSWLEKGLAVEVH